MVAQVLKQVAKGMRWNAITAEWRGSVTKEAIAEAVEPRRVRVLAHRLSARK